MDGTAIAQWVGISLIAAGQIFNFVKNGLGISKDVEHIKNELNSPDHGLNALKNGISGMQTHCAQVSTALATQVTNHEKDIDELKRKTG